MMSGRKRDEYLNLRRQYQPESIKLVIVAESPPASGLYFYDPEGSVGEPLFSAFMQQLGASPKTKAEGLHEFQGRGWVLIDATYKPVNMLSDPIRNKVIEQDYPKLREDLATLLRDNPSAPLVLVKANVCKLSEPKLMEDGFNVLNAGRIIYFPAFGQQRNFQRQFSEITRHAGRAHRPLSLLR